MLPLAFNTILPQSLKTKHQFALAVLPIGLMFASFGLIFLFAYWLEGVLDIPHNSPIRDHPNGTTWLVVFLGVMVVLMILGYLLGWLANGLISRYVLGWPMSRVVAVYMRSQVPPEWLKQPSSGGTISLPKDQLASQRWEIQRTAGALRFIFTRGVLGWGGAMFLVMYLLPAVSHGTPLDFMTAAIQAALWAGAGAGFGGVIWILSEWNHRKSKARNGA